MIVDASLSTVLEEWEKGLLGYRNDYGESHYVGPLSSPHIDDGNSKWTNDM